MRADSLKGFTNEVMRLKAAGLFKPERVLKSRQGPEIEVEGLGKVLNFCSNNYLGLANDPRVITAARRAIDKYGYGLSSVRFICGTLKIHKALERRIAQYLGADDALVATSCFDANAGFFECLFGPDDAVFSDELNHASIIDGLRLSKFQKHIYKHADAADLEAHLKTAASARARIIVTDGVFSMNGDYAPLKEICALAEKYDAFVMVDDSHATGFVGPQGRGTAAAVGVARSVDIITGTFSKALGGGNGGFIAGREPIIDLLRQRLRPYTFSSALSPIAAAAGLAVLNIVEPADNLRAKLWANVDYFRAGLIKLGFNLKPSRHPIVPIMLYDAQKAQEFSKRLLAEKILAVGFFYPVVPEGQARLRVQISAAHTNTHLNKALAALGKIGRELGSISGASGKFATGSKK